MKVGIILSILFIDAVLPDIGLGASTKSSVKENSLLPWQIIADKFREGSRFCSEEISPSNDTQKYKILRIGSADPNRSYTCLPAQSLLIRLPEKAADFISLENIRVDIAEFIEGSWLVIGNAIKNSESNEIIFRSGIGKEGFFRTSFTTLTQGEQQLNHEAYYAVICSNWKKDILTFCRALKEEIEFNQDSQLIRSSIAVSHVDHTMEIIGETSFLSEKILKALADALQSKKAFESGRCPDLVIGLNKIRLKRFEGAPIEEFVVFVPENYTSLRPWPVLLNTDNRRLGAKGQYIDRSGLIDIWWHTVSHKDLKWKNYTALMEVIEQKVNIDKDRIYIYGECSNGIAAIALALNYPDQWAECSSSLGNSYRHLAGNALNLPIILVGDIGHDEDSLVGYYEFAVKCFQYYSSMYFKHSQTQNIIQARGARLPETVRIKKPQRVLYTIESLGNPKAYWVKIEGRVDENLPGAIDTCVEGQTIQVKTKNIDAYSFDLVQAPLDSNEPVEIIENRQSLGFIKDQIFTKRIKKYIDAIHIKNEHLNGPIWDAFTESYVVVWGASRDDKELTGINKMVAKSLAGEGPVFTDANMPEKLLDSHNLILVGTSESNLWLSKISKQLPILVEDGVIIVGDKRYNERDMGFILIYPNPVNVLKYVAVFSGTSTKAISKIPDAYSQMRSIRPIDVGVFEVTDNDSIKWHIFEKFNTLWDWHSEWDRVLMVVNKKHPKWRWDQWAAKIVKEQLETNIAICESPFLFEDSELAGQVTYRDLFNAFRNDWIVKIKLDGNNLRKLLTVPFADISKREVRSLIISGVSYEKKKQHSFGSILVMSELENEQIYTIAVPEKLINGQRTGIVLKDYRIVGDCYLIPLLKDYLYKGKNLDVDTELDKLKLDVF